MLKPTSITELNGFLANHEAVSKPRVLNSGLVLGGWKIVGFLGSGGMSEVYRVVRVDGTSGTIGTGRTGCTDGRARSPSAPQPQQNECAVDESVGALKILLRDDAASRRRFAQEVNLLQTNRSPSFARFYGAGEIHGRPYLVTELLEPIDLPNTDAAVADYLLNVCRAVDQLHHAGLIHRDLKPSNIMRRTNGEVVLIDLGLVKDKVLSSEPVKDVSIVSDKVVAVGTPRFAAPEQMMGGEVTAATDIHAIGRLADAAFDSKPPRCWLPIIRRATSSIPEQRYQSVADLAQAIRRRHRQTSSVLAACVAGVGAVALGTVLVAHRQTPSVNSAAAESAAWIALCHKATTNLVSRELLSERLFTNRVGKSEIVIPLQTYRYVTNRVDAVLVQLNGEKHDFVHPIVLDAAREYLIEGPGTLAADLRSSGREVRIHMAKCGVFNRSTVPIDKAGIRYVFGRGAYLNFSEQDEVPRSIVNAHIEEFDKAYNEIRFRGSDSNERLNGVREKENRQQLNRDAKTFSKNFHFPCRFLPVREKYVVEDMKDSIYKKYGIDPNRAPTDAEVAAVAYCFGVSKDEARVILTTKYSENKKRKG